MKVLSSFVAVTLFLVILSGCENQVVVRDFDDDSFMESEVLSRQERGLDFKFTPGDLWAVDDSLILLRNQGRKDSMYVVVRASDWNVKSVFGEIGEGEDQFIYPQILKSSDDVMIRDILGSKVTTVDPISGKMTHVDLKLPIDDRAYDIFYEDGAYIYENFNRPSVGTIIKLKGDERVVLLDFLELHREIGDENHYGYRGSMGVNPKDGRVVYAYEYIRRFDIVSGDGELLSTNIDPNSKYPVVYNGKLNRQQSTIYYKGVSVSEDRIYLYYIGESPLGFMEQGMVTYIEEFDWEGTPIKRYRLDDYFSYIAYLDGSFICISPKFNSKYVIYNIK